MIRSLQQSQCAWEALLGRVSRYTNRRGNLNAALFGAVAYFNGDPAEGWRDTPPLGDPELIGIRDPDVDQVNEGGGR